MYLTILNEIIMRFVNPHPSLLPLEEGAIELQKNNSLRYRSGMADGFSRRQPQKAYPLPFAL
jgi:folate-dependent phosphoribosylglycinamide formyltransferase PurN